MKSKGEKSFSADSNYVKSSRMNQEGQKTNFKHAYLKDFQGYLNGL